MVYTQEIIIGVFAGVITSAALYVAKEFWSKIFAPWYLGFRYRGADISGAWFAQFKDEDDSSESTFSLALSQSAHLVKGSLQFTFKSTERNFSIEYEVKGEYWEGYLHLFCKSKDRRAYSYGVMFIKLINNGTGLLGSYSFRHATDDKVETLPIGLDRS